MEKEKKFSLKKAEQNFHPKMELRFQEGIYLDDLASFNDATQIEKYLGRKGGGNR